MNKINAMQKRLINGLKKTKTDQGDAVLVSDIELFMEKMEILPFTRDEFKKEMTEFAAKSAKEILKSFCENLRKG